LGGYPAHEIQVDMAIIDAGTAGLSAYRAAKTHTDNVIMIENGPYYHPVAEEGLRLIRKVIYRRRTT
jgi:flavin-dependent dehydrogenase